MQSVGERLEAVLLVIKERHGFNEHQLAAETGINPASWRRWRAGDRLPNYSRLERLVRLYGVNPNYIFGIEGAPMFLRDAAAESYADELPPGGTQARRASPRARTPSRPDAQDQSTPRARGRRAP